MGRGARQFSALVQDQRFAHRQFTAAKQVVHINRFVVFNHDDAALHQVLQFPDIAREVVLQQRANGPGGEAGDFAAVQRPYYRDPERVALRKVFDYMADYTLDPAVPLRPAGLSG